MFPPKWKRAGRATGPHAHDNARHTTKTQDKSNIQINSTQQLTVGMKCQDGGQKCFFLLARPAHYAY